KLMDLDAEEAALSGRTRSLKGLSTEDVLAAVEVAVDPADRDLLAKIEALCEERGKVLLRHPHTGEPWLDENGEQFCDVHGFVYWRVGLGLGSWTLPEPIPHAFLEGFNDPHAMVLARCENCQCGVTNVYRWRGHLNCPACGSGNVSAKKLSMPG